MRNKNEWDLGMDRVRGYQQCDDKNSNDALAMWADSKVQLKGLTAADSTTNVT